jgi:hypothetical protein
LTDALRRGVGVEANDRAAVSWLWEAVGEAKFPARARALNLLAIRRSRGDGVRRDPVVALALSILSDRDGGTIERNRTWLASRLQPNERAATERLVAAWIPEPLLGRYGPDDP